MNVLYYDDEIVVAVKDAGILSQSDDKDRKNMPAELTRELGGPIYAVHRLDRETAGVMVFARNKNSAAVLSSAIAEGNFEKEYLAIVSGALEEKTGQMEDLLYFDRTKNKVFPVKRERKGVKKALLSYEVLNEKDGLSLVLVKPKTGRTHQIRVQFASRRHPLYGDRKYGGSGDHLALFCRSLAFSHPKSGKKVSFTHEEFDSEILKSIT